MMKFVTYNVLSGALAAKHPHLSKEILENRRERIKTKLEKETEPNTVICLQEVEQDFGDELVPWFKSMGYSCERAHYGHYHNGYMGILIAYNGELQDLKTKKIADIIPYVKQEKQHWLWNYWSPQKPSTNALAKKRFNQAIAVKINDVWVVNYHMPCAFDNSEFMDLHTKALMEFSLSLGERVVIAGDMNFVPHGRQYMLLNDFGFVSSQFEIFGEEPKATCASCRSEKLGIFRGALDYILGHGLTFTSANNVSIKSEELPDMEEPSDHVLLWAEVE